MDNVPTHIAIIMDGNRRWAREKGIPILKGHQKVVDDILEPLVERSADLGVKYITFWAFSTENWKREQAEVSGLMRIFRHLFTRRMERLHEKGVRIRTIGDLSQFPQDIQATLSNVKEKTKDNKRITAIFALNYGGRDEILRAINKVISHKYTTISKSESLQLTAESFASFLDTADIPDPELIIRTGGEQRLSGFLLWQSNYAELYFPDFYMPDFVPDKLNEAIEEFQHRKRRFGK